MICRTFYILVILALPLCSIAVAGDSGDAGTESPFSLGAGARAMGMGNGFVAVADDATAIYYNPAGLPNLGFQQISVLHTVLFEGTIYDFISYARPLGNRYGFGIAGMRLGTDNIGRRDNLTSFPNNAEEDAARFNASQMQLIISLGRRIGSKISSGISLKLVNQSIDNLSAYGFGIDLGTQLAIGKNLKAGILLQDIIGPRMKLINLTERTPFTIRAGMAYLIESDKSPFNTMFVLDLEKPERRSVKVRAGVEMIHETGVVLRGGYDRDNFTMGMGLRYKELHFDYAYKFIEYLTDSHRFSLTLEFGKSRMEKLAGKEQAALSEHLQFAKESRRKSLLAELEKADNYYLQGDLDSALAAYYRADAFAEDHTYIQARILKINNQLSRATISTSPITLPDSVAASLPGTLENQARRLFARNAFRAAQDLVAMTRQYHGSLPALDSLENDIRNAIDSVVAVNFAQAENALGNGNYIRAYDCFNSVLVLDPGSGRAREGSQAAEMRLNLAQHLNLALEYFNQDKYTSSKREFRIVLDMDSNNKTGIEYLRRINEKIKSSTSMEDLQKDTRIWQLYLAGLEAFRLGNFEEAIGFWDDVLEVYPNNQNTIENINQARLRLKK